MHIVHLGKYYFPAVGGMESLIRTQALAQAESGHKIEVVAINHLTISGKDLLSNSIGRTPSCHEKDGPVNVHRVGRVGNFAKCDLTITLRRTIAKIAQGKPDIWHLHTPNATMVLCLQSLGKICQPLVVTHHSDIVNQKILRPAYQFAERLIYKRATKIVSDSADYITGSKQLLPFVKKTSVLPIGVDIKSVQALDDETLHWQNHYQKLFGHPTWLCVGRLASYKGLGTAIEALRMTPGRLAIIGTGPCESKWKSLAKQLGVDDRIHWLGRCSDAQLRAAYRTATALWFPSNARNEGFGIVQVEAMACGCPVINTRIPNSGVSWVSLHEESGLTIPIDDPVALSSASLRILNEHGLRPRLSAGSVSRVSAFFDQTKLNGQCLDLYSTVLEQNGN